MTKSHWPVVTLMLVTLLLVAFGIVLVATASNVRAETIYGSQHHFLIRQLIWVGIALPVGFAVGLFDYHIWRRHKIFTWIVCIAIVLALAAVITPGIRHQVNGSYRWLRLGPINVQPSELAKFMTVVAMSVWLSSLGGRVREFLRGIVLPGVGLVLVAGLVMIEPDFGSVMVLLLCGGVLMVVAGVRILHAIPLATIAIVVIMAFISRDENRMRRLKEHLDDTPYQVEQSLLAFKLGGLKGVGFTNSIQKHKYLPEAHTDFIFSICGEEFGYLATISVVLAYVMMLICGVIISKNAPDRFGKLLAFGMTFLLIFQAGWNIAMVTQCTITKGMALPFLSYGGTNIVVAVAAVATIVSVGRATNNSEVVKNVAIAG